VCRARVAAMAKRTSLAVEASMLQKQQALLQELCLQQKKQQLTLETEMAKAKAEEHVLAEAEAGLTEVGEDRGFCITVPSVVKTDFCKPRVSKVEPSETLQLPARTEQLPIVNWVPAENSATERWISEILFLGRKDFNKLWIYSGSSRNRIVIRCLYNNSKTIKCNSY